MSTVDRYDVHEFGHPVEMVMASAHDEIVERMKKRILELELKVSDQYIETCADTVLIQRVISENSHLRSDVDVLGNVLAMSIGIAARYLDAHKAFRQRIKILSESFHEIGDPIIELGNLRDALARAVMDDH